MGLDEFIQAHSLTHSAWQLSLMANFLIPFVVVAVLFVIPWSIGGRLLRRMKQKPQPPVGLS